MEDKRALKRARIGVHEAFSALEEDANGAMYVKVNMEGYTVGRKIDLKAHSNYDSLSDSLQKMFRNFLSVDYSNSAEHKRIEPSFCDCLLLYEDHEGDRMLVGDVPWEMFVTSVKRLYIVRNPKPQASAELCRATSPSGSMFVKGYEE